MKLNDVDVKINEDLGDWLKSTVEKSGILGQSARLGAEQSELQKKIYNTGLRYFKNQLSQSLDRAVRTGYVTTDTASVKPQSIAQATAQIDKTQTGNGVKVRPGTRLVIPKTGDTEYYKTDKGWFDAPGVMTGKLTDQSITDSNSIAYLEKLVKDNPDNVKVEQLPQSSTDAKKKTRESSQFDFLNMITESKILNEQDTVGGFITDFVRSQTDEFQPNQKIQNFINNAIRTAEQEYLKTGKISDKTYEQLWSGVFNWSTLQTRGTRGGSSIRGGYQSNRDSNDNGVDDGVERERWKTGLSDKIKKLDLNDPESLDDLEIIAHDIEEFVAKSRRK